MQQDTVPPIGSAWTPEAASVPSSPQRPYTAEDWPAAPNAQHEDGLRLRRLLWVFTILTVILVAPSVVSRVEYARVAAQERARLDIARANLKDFKLDQISAAYRLLAQSVGPSVVNITYRNVMISATRER